MAGDLGLLSLTQLHKLAQQHPNPSSTPGSLMWNTTRRTAPDDDDSWEVRAFAEDTGNTMGTTWPPRSYTCTFCRREFRSAQALGGHMNVHRRDRARLRQSPPVSDPTPSPTSSSPFIFPTQEFVASGGLCLFYPLPNHGAVFTQAPENGCLESPSTHLSISPCTPFTSSKAISSNPHSFSFPGMDTTSICQPSKVQSQVPINNDSNDDDEDDHDHDSKSKNVCNNHNEPIVEELDLELRLGQRPTQH